MAPGRVDGAGLAFMICGMSWPRNIQTPLQTQQQTHEIAHALHYGGVLQRSALCVASTGPSHLRPAS